MAANPYVSLRVQSKGGAVSSAALIGPRTALTSRKHVVLLIHGYNNDYDDAALAYDWCRRLQSEIAQVPSDAVAGGALVEVFWPGDESWGPASFLFYPFAIKRAEQTADKLADALRDAVVRGGWTSVDVIAHSLGCRVACELADRLRAVPGIFLRRFVLMAAAVPTFLLERRRPLRAGIDAVAEGVLSLSSTGDEVLAYAFPLGETAGMTGVLPTALGHELWSGLERPIRLRQTSMNEANHGDYWGWNEKTRRAIGRRANEKVADFLGFRIAARRLSERGLAKRFGSLERHGVEARARLVK